MGGSKKTYYDVPLPSYYYQLTGFQGKPGVDIAPFTQALEEKKGSKIASLTEERVGRLRNAIMAAIGSLSYNPYEKLVTESIGKTVSAPYETIEKPYIEASSKIAPSLKTAGALVALPPPKAGEESYLPTYQEAFKSAKEFLTSTKEVLSNFGFQENEITEAMAPYLSSIREGISSSLKMGGTIQPEYAGFVQEWGLV